MGRILVKKSAGLIRPGRKTRRKKFWPALSRIQSRRMSMDLDFFGRTDYHHGYALAEGVERGVVGDRGWGKIEGVGL